MMNDDTQLGGDEVGEGGATGGGESPPFVPVSFQPVPRLVPKVRTRLDASPPGLYRAASGRWYLDAWCQGQRVRKSYGAATAEEATARAEADLLVFHLRVMGRPRTRPGPRTPRPLALPPVLAALVDTWPVRFLKRVRVDERGCWIWTGWLDLDGYGRFRGRGAHTFACEHAHGPIAPGLEPDHLCRARACVNPDHIEPVTHKVNVLRGFAARARRAGQKFSI
jgi:hypothetical protein